MNHALLAHDTPDVSRLQAKSLRVNQSGDSFEREADRVADTVSSGGYVATKLPAWSLTGAVQRQTPTPGQPTGPQPEPGPNNYGDALGKVAEAALKTKAVQDMLAHLTEDDPLVKSTLDFVKTPGGIAVTGAAAVGVIATLAATHRPLPIQVPSIPLDKISSRFSGFSLQLTYHGPVDRPTDAMVSISYDGGVGKKKKKPTDHDKFRAETAAIAADRQKFREGLQPAAGPQADPRKQEGVSVRDSLLRRIGALPAVGAGKDQAHKTDASPLITPPESASPAEKKAAHPKVSDAAKEEIPVQRKAAANTEAAHDSAEVGDTLRSGGRPLDRETRSYMESRIGFDFSRVRVHTDSEAATSAKTMGALAYTVGSDVVFARGTYSPQTPQGRHLLAHELTHVVQQSPVSRPVAGTAAPIARTAPRRAQRSLNPLDWVRDKVLAKLKTVPGYDLFTVIIEQDPITGQHVDRTAINVIRGILDLVPGGSDTFKRLEESHAIERAYEWLKGEVDKLGFSVKYFLDLLGQVKDAITLSFDETWARIKEIFSQPYQKLKNFASAVLHKILDFILEVGLEALGGKEIATQIMDFFRKAGNAITTIVKDPAAFVGHLLDALKQGFGQFATNILEHLKKGLFEWLFGEIAATGIVLPKTFDISGIVNLVLQVLGITWARFKKKLENVLGEPAVQFLEGAFDFIKAVANGGLGAGWKLILDRAENLFDTALAAVRDWVVTEIVTQAIKHLAPLFNPIGGAIEAIRIIYETIKFFIEKAKQVASLIKAIVDSIAEIAAGNIGKAANWIEESLSRAIPLVLRFLAGFLGLGGIGDKIKGVIKKLQDKVDGAMDKVLNFVVEKGRALWAAGKAGFNYIAEWWKAKRPFQIGDEKHELSIEGDEDHPQIMVASDSPTTLKIFLDNVNATSAEKKKLMALANKIKLRKRKPTDKGVDSEKIFDELLDEISKLKSAGVGEIKPSKITKQTTNPLGGGEGVDAYISLNHPVGTKPEQDSKPAIWEDLGPTLRDKKSYVRGHLLSQRLGGQGEWENMMPVTNSANQTMYSNAEKAIINTVATGKKAVHYKVWANYNNLKPATTPPDAEKRLGDVRWEWNLADYVGNDWKDAKNAKKIEPDGGSGSVPATK